MTASTLTIDRFRSVYRIPADHPQPEQVRGRLDHVLELDVSAALEAAISEVLPLSSESAAAIWLIRRLEVEVLIDVGAFDENQIGRGWGAALARAIARAMADGADGDNVQYFSSPASYTAQFLIDLVDGWAWSRWYFDAFDGLRTLPISTAACEALLREPAFVPAVIRQMAARQRLERLLVLLSEPDAARIAAAWREIDPLPPDRAAIDAIIAVWRDLAIDMRAEHMTPSAYRLWALAHVAESISSAPASVDAIFDFWGTLRRVASPAALIDALAAKQWRQAAEITAGGTFDLPLWISLVNGDQAWIGHIAAALMPASAAGFASAEAEPQAATTPYGGVFLLAAALIWDRLDDVIAAALMRCAVFAACLGDANAAYDSHVHLISGLETIPTDSDWEFLSHLSLTVLREQLVNTLSVTGRAEGRFLCAERVMVRDEAMILLRDLADDTWLLLAPMNEAAPAWESIRAALPIPVERVFADDSLHTTLESLGLPAAPIDDASPVLVRFQRRAKPAPIEIAHYEQGLAVLSSLEAAHTAALITISHAVMRAFAHRLSGFEWSSAAYLKDRFLGGISKVVHSGGLIDVTLPHSPLEIVLRMAGFNQYEFVPDWLAGVTIQLKLP